MRILVLISLLLAAFMPVFGTEMMPSADVRPGMRGYGLSVFHGWEPESFQVEIVDVIRNANPGGDLILARFSGKNLETSGVIAGMSGSPVFITNAGGGEKLIGAVAYGWPSTKETIGCIQPIFQMLSEKGLADSGFQPAPRSATPGRLSIPLSGEGFTAEALSFLSTNFAADVSSGNDSVPAISGLAGFSDGENAGPASEGLHPGDAVALNMVDGDLRLQGVGTVTWVSNDDVYIFGHQMDLAGNVKLPVSRSYIYSVISADPISFKLGSSSKPIGSTVYDGEHGVYCRTGDAPAMVPVELRLQSWVKEKTFHFRVADSRTQLPGLVAACIGSSLTSVAGALEDKRVTMAFRIETEGPSGQRTLSNRFQYSFVPSYFNSWMLLNDLQGWLAFLLQNDVAKLSIRKIDLDVSMERGAKYLSLQGVSLDRLQYLPGDTVVARVHLREYRGDNRTCELRIPLPSKIAPGQYRVIVGSDSAVVLEIARLFPRYYAAQNLDDLERLAQLRQEAETLVAAVAVPRNGLYTPQGRLENFPAQYARLYSGGLDSLNPTAYPDVLDSRITLDAALFGLWSATITVAEKTAAIAGE